MPSGQIMLLLLICMAILAGSKVVEGSEGEEEEEGEGGEDGRDEKECMYHGG